MIKTCEKLFRYLRMDISRGICSGGFLLGIAGVFLTLMFGTVDDITLDTTVFFVFDLIQYGMPSMIVMLVLRISLCKQFLSGYGESLCVSYGSEGICLPVYFIQVYHDISNCPVDLFHWNNAVCPVSAVQNALGGR